MQAAADNPIREDFLEDLKPWNHSFELLLQRLGTCSLRFFVRWTREWLKSERRIFGKAIVGDTFHQGTLMLKSTRQAYAAGGATSGISGVRLGRE